MAARHGLTLVSVCAALLAVGACSETPTSPEAPSTGRSNYAPLDVRCWIEGSLLCSVNRFGEGDLTDKAQWFATDLPWGTTPDPAVTFTRAGVPVASRSVKLYIAARVGAETDTSPLSYELAPGATPIPLAALVGFTYEGDTGFTTLEGVRIEIVGGNGVSAASLVSGGGGFYQFTHVRVGVPFTMRASKEGYTSVEVQHAGIRVLDGGFPDTASAAQHFRMNRRQ